MFTWAFTFKPNADTTLEDLERAGLTPTFDDRESAEAWLGQYFFDLDEYGVSDVTLKDGETIVMGPMSLE